MTVKFSILTACHNNAQQLIDCVQSVMSQKYKNWEWIIVDDCSTDSSWGILTSLKDERIKVFKNAKQLFCSSTYARCLNESSGEICGVLDADDALHPDAIDEVVKRYEKMPHIGYIYTQHFWCDAKLRVKRTGLSSMPARNSNLLQTSLINKKHCFSHFRTFRRSLAGKAVIFPPKLKYAVDKNMGFVLEELSQGAFFPKRLYYYRYHKKNMSLQHGSDQKATWKSLAVNRQKLRDRNKIRCYPIVRIK